MHAWEDRSVKALIVLSGMTSSVQHMLEGGEYDKMMSIVDRLGAGTLALCLVAKHVKKNGYTRPPYIAILMFALQLLVCCDMGWCGAPLTSLYIYMHSLWHICIWYYIYIIPSVIESV